MRRRSFLPMLAAPAIPALQAQPARNGKLKISAVEIFRVEGKREATVGVNAQRQANPIHIYPEYRPPVYKDGTPEKRTVNAGAIYLRLKTDQGVEGLYGPIDREAAIVIDQQLRTYLMGKDPLAGEALWDQLHRSNRHSRRGHYMMAISAADNALWDLRGRYFNTPVYRLLGGPTRAEAEAYGSCLGFSLEPEKVHEKSRQLKADGFQNQKWFLAYGPGSGPEGLERNVELVKNLRDAVGDNVNLMFDAFMGWDLNYAKWWVKRVEQYRPRWIEEAFQIDKIEAFAELRRYSSVPVASGEHFYGRWEVHDYLRANALDVVQADPEWCGGVSELVKICTVASLHDVQVIPHGHAVHAALHVVASQSPSTCPLVEYLLSSRAAYYHFEKNPPVPVKGKIALSERPGFGIELDAAKIEKQTPLSWS